MVENVDERQSQNQTTTGEEIITTGQQQPVTDEAEQVETNVELEQQPNIMTNPTPVDGTNESTANNEEHKAQPGAKILGSGARRNGMESGTLSA